MREPADDPVGCVARRGFLLSSCVVGAGGLVAEIAAVLDEGNLGEPPEQRRESYVEALMNDSGRRIRNLDRRRESGRRGRQSVRSAS